MKRQQTAASNAKQERVAFLMAAGRSVKAAAEESGVGERTIHTWLKDSEFKTLVDEMRARILSEAVGKLASSTDKAVQTLLNLLDDTNSTVRLRAAMGVIDSLLKVREHVELEPRITRLERIADESVPDQEG